MSYLFNTGLFLIILVLITVAGFIGFKLKFLRLERSNSKVNQQLLAKIAELQGDKQKYKALEKAAPSCNEVDVQGMAILLHDIRSPLRFLCTISGCALKEYSNGKLTKNHDHLLKLHQSLESLRSFVEASYNWVSGTDRTFSTCFRLVKIQDVFNQLEKFFGEFFSYNGNSLIITPTDLFWHTDPDVLNLILRNLLDNANKYTESGKTWLNCFQKGGNLCIQVKDSGFGLTENQIKSFLLPFNAPETMGLGSQVISKMLQKLNGHLHIEAQPGQGSVFTIELSPLEAKMEGLTAESRPTVPGDIENCLAGELH